MCSQWSLQDPSRQLSRWTDWIDRMTDPWDKSSKEDVFPRE